MCAHGCGGEWRHDIPKPDHVQYYGIEGCRAGHVFLYPLYPPPAHIPPVHWRRSSPTISLRLFFLPPLHSTFNFDSRASTSTSTRKTCFEYFTPFSNSFGETSISSLYSLLYIYMLYTYIAIIYAVWSYSILPPLVLDVRNIYLYFIIPRVQCVIT